MYLHLKWYQTYYYTVIRQLICVIDSLSTVLVQNVSKFLLYSSQDSNTLIVQLGEKVSYINWTSGGKD